VIHNTKKVLEDVNKGYVLVNVHYEASRAAGKITQNYCTLRFEKNHRFESTIIFFSLFGIQYI
jgi:hypothetical protein